MLRFEEMGEAEFAAFITWLNQNYAQAHVEAGNWLPSESLHLAEEETARLLPEGRSSPNQYVRKVVDENGVRVGTIWYALQSWGGIPRVWIFWIGVNEDQRRRGIGAAILRQVEEEARRLGAGGVALHVFASNGPARALYERSGYATASLFLRKDLGG